MKPTTKLLLVGVGVGVIAVAVSLLSPPFANSQPDNKIEQPRPTTEQKAFPDRWARRSRQNAAEPVELPTAKTTTHLSADFNKGELENTLVTDGLQMGSDARFIPRLAPYKRFGIYISPEEQATELFDTVIPNYNATVSEANNLTFEVRTKSMADNWSTWQEIGSNALDKPFKLNAPALSWQYRLTFYANDLDQSPKVHSVSIAIKTTPATIASGDESSSILPPQQLPATDQ